MVRCLTTFAAVIIISGCASCPPHADFNLPIRPHLADYTEAEWQSLPQSAREKIVSDDLEVKRYIRQAEERARNHNET